MACLICHNTIPMPSSVPPDRTTVLAADRTALAIERTYAAWVRTGLAALASGIGARALLSGVVPGWLALSTSTMLILFSGFAFFAGLWRELSLGDLLPEQGLRRMPAGMAVVGNGFLIVVSASALIGTLLINARW